MDKYTKISLLYDFYGGLLTNRQQEILKLYYFENFTLSEIAEEFGISRQGVHDTVKSGESSLANYEKNLKLIDKFQETNKAINTIDKLIDDLLVDCQESNKLIIKKIKEIIDKLEQ